MAKIDVKNRKIRAKLVYYGPGLCGKTTNLQYINKSMTQKQELMSLATEGDRTIFFDFMPLDIGKLWGMDVEFKLYTVPGQVRYNQTRKMVLKNVDGVVFVADSQRAMIDPNQESLNNLYSNLRELGIDEHHVPIILQYNKRDLPNVMSTKELDAALNDRNYPTFAASAYTGEGVFATLKAACSAVLVHVEKSMPRPDGAASQAPRKPSKPTARNPAPARRVGAQTVQGAAPPPAPAKAVAAPPSAPGTPARPAASAAAQATATMKPITEAPSPSRDPRSQDTIAVPKTTSGTASSSASESKGNGSNGSNLQSLVTRLDALDDAVRKSSQISADNHRFITGYLETLRKTFDRRTGEQSIPPGVQEMEKVAAALEQGPTKKDLEELRAMVAQTPTKKDLETILTRLPKGGAGPEVEKLTARLAQLPTKKDLETLTAQSPKESPGTDLRKLTEMLAQLPTRSDFDGLQKRLAQLATKTEVEALRRAVDGLAARPVPAAPAPVARPAAFAPVAKPAAPAAPSTASRPAEPGPVATKPTDPKPTPTTLDGPGPIQQKPAETKASQPADAKAGEPKPPPDAPAEAKPVEAKPEEAKPEEVKPAEAKPAEAKPPETNPTEDTPSTPEPAKPEPAPAEPAESKPAEAKSAADKPAEAKPPSSNEFANDPDHLNAARVARVMIADLYLYQKDDVDAGLREGDFFERNKEALDDIRATYEQRIDASIRDKKDHLAEALDTFLAKKRKALGLEEAVEEKQGSDNQPGADKEVQAEKGHDSDEEGKTDDGAADAAPAKPADSGKSNEAAPGTGENFDDDPAHQNAARIARVMIADLYLYQKDDVEEGLRQGDFMKRNEEALQDIRSTYESRVAADIREKKDYLGEALQAFIEKKRKALGLS